MTIVWRSVGVLTRRTLIAESSMRGVLMRSDRVVRRWLRVVAVSAVVAVAASCQPGTPALFPTGTFQTTIGTYAYSATSPLWHVDSFSIPEDFTLWLTDPLADSLMGAPELWPESGAYYMGLQVSLPGSVLEPGTYVVGLDPGEAYIGLYLSTWEDLRAVGESAYEEHWSCFAYNLPGVPPTTGTVSISDLVFAGNRVQAMRVSWDLSCPTFIVAGEQRTSGPPLTWVGSATYNS